MRKIHAAEPRWRDGFPDRWRRLVGRSEYLDAERCSLNGGAARKGGIRFPKFSAVADAVRDGERGIAAHAGRTQAIARRGERTIALGGNGRICGPPTLSTFGG